MQLTVIFPIAVVSFSPVLPAIFLVGLIIRILMNLLPFPDSLSLPLAIRTVTILLVSYSGIRKIHILAMPASFLVPGFPPWETIIGYRSSKKKDFKYKSGRKRKGINLWSASSPVNQVYFFIGKMVGFLGGDNTWGISLKRCTQKITNPSQYNIPPVIVRMLGYFYRIPLPH